MAETITSKHAHLIGIGRPSVLYPNYPKLILNPDPTTTTAEDAVSSKAADNIYYPEVPNPAWIRALNTSLIGAGINTAWHCALMWWLGAGKWDGLKSRSGGLDASLTVGEVQTAPLTRREMPRIGAMGSMIDMWRA